MTNARGVGTYRIPEQSTVRRDCAPTQSRPSLCCSYIQTIKLDECSDYPTAHLDTCVDPEFFFQKAFRAIQKAFRWRADNGGTFNTCLEGNFVNFQ